ncbi:MAG: hypothetical protein H6Q41_1215 [Deltaproteobacteria bacterium]|nr:hypothetical protein [Deltaproteobacteria bacterium]
MPVISFLSLVFIYPNTNLSHPQTIFQENSTLCPVLEFFIAFVLPREMEHDRSEPGSTAYVLHDNTPQPVLGIPIWKILSVKRIYHFLVGLTCSMSMSKQLTPFAPFADPFPAIYPMVGRPVDSLYQMKGRSEHLNSRKNVKNL